jgi:lysozyme family protein
MQHPFDVLKEEYETLLSSCQIFRIADAKARAEKLINLKPYYEEVSARTGVPIVWLMAINERESGSNLHDYLGNGEPLSRRTTLVPKGRGPFDSWAAGAIDAIQLDHINEVSVWSWPRSLYEGEAWNGFGPRSHGRHTGYLWAGTNIYDGGKYVADGVWEYDEFDHQLGLVPLMAALIAVDPSLNFDTSNIPVRRVIAAEAAAVPQGHDGGAHGVEWLQTALNKLERAGLAVDGNYGRATRLAVREFQAAHNLEADGLAGPITIGAVEKALA